MAKEEQQRRAAVEIERRAALRATLAVEVRTVQAAPVPRVAVGVVGQLISSLAFALGKVSDADRRADKGLAEQVKAAKQLLKDLEKEEQEENDMVARKEAKQQKEAAVTIQVRAGVEGQVAK